MTKLVDVQGLKPCLIRGSGSSPDTGNIYFLDVTLFFIPTTLYLFSIYNYYLHIFNWSNSLWVSFNLFSSSIVLHVSFIFVFLLILFTIN